MSNVRGEQFRTLDPATGLTHTAQAMAWSDGLVMMDATLCDVEVGVRWTRKTLTDPVTCLFCLAKEGE